ncbi:unnamed protein product [Darwinula stevensoni]|uniref:Uncharacterized protein n=1 Tax=Darwinula stevensoni TaxID=69355 RepID=A0A7R8X017_9CRUS|nr:unnamed protein product [Darwinula stevensoni]CAG0880635.1 unnamed protein product [Darwinula stevensoni]
MRVLLVLLFAGLAVASPRSRYRRQLVVQRPEAEADVETDAEFVPPKQDTFQQEEDENENGNGNGNGNRGDERGTGFQTFVFRPFFPRVRMPFFDFRLPTFRPSFGAYPPFNRRQPFGGVVEVDVGGDNDGDDSQVEEDRFPVVRPESSRPSLFNFGNVFDEFTRHFEDLERRMSVLWNALRNRGDDDDDGDGASPDALPNGYRNTTSTTKVVNGSIVTVNETVHKTGGDDGQSFFHFKVVHIRPEFGQGSDVEVTQEEDEEEQDFEYPGQKGTEAPKVPEQEQQGSEFPGKKQEGGSEFPGKEQEDEFEEFPGNKGTESISEGPELFPLEPLEVNEVLKDDEKVPVVNLGQLTLS